MVINYFESLDAVKRFAGEDYTVPVFEPEARALLSRIEDVATHYEVRTGAELLGGTSEEAKAAADEIRRRAKGSDGKFDWEEVKADRDRGRP